MKAISTEVSCGRRRVRLHGLSTVPRKDAKINPRRTGPEKPTYPFMIRQLSLCAAESIMKDYES